MSGVVQGVKGAGDCHSFKLGPIQIHLVSRGEITTLGCPVFGTLSQIFLATPGSLSLMPKKCKTTFIFFKKIILDPPAEPFVITRIQMVPPMKVEKCYIKK